jgi:hypothetical protein
MPRIERFTRGLAAFVIGLLIASLLAFLFPHVLDARHKILQSIRAVFDRK